MADYDIITFHGRGKVSISFINIVRPICQFDIGDRAYVLKTECNVFKLDMNFVPPFLYHRKTLHGLVLKGFSPKCMRLSLRNAREMWIKMKELGWEE